MMLHFRTLAFGLLALGGLNVLALAADLNNSTCLPTGTWRCLNQGSRICNNKPGCLGDCYQCVGSPTLPDKMCFDKEGSKCTPVNNVVCGASAPDGQCITVDTTCTCKSTKGTVLTPCTFASCN